MTTSNGRLNVEFPAAPPYSLLTFGGKTSNAAVAVSLNPAYEGTFFLATSNAKTSVNHNKGVIDPSGRHRERMLKMNDAGTFVTGEVYWDDATGRESSKPAGFVSVSSSNGPIELDV